MLINRLAALFARAPRSSGRKTLVSRLALEGLETREVPAALLWTNAHNNGFFADPGNWTNQATNAPSTTVPSSNDDVIFNNTSPSLTVALPANFILNVKSVQLQNGFSGTVAFNSGFAIQTNEIDILSGAASSASPITVVTYNQTGGVATLNGATMTATNLNLSGGTLDQPVAGSDITATNSFTWTGGILNSSNNGANLFVNGTGTIAPVGAGSLNTNDTLQFVGGQNAPASTTMFPGTVVFGAVGGGVVVGAFATLTAKTVTTGDINGLTMNQAGATQFAMYANSTFNIIGPGKINYNLPIINLGGTFSVSGSAQVNLAGVNPNKLDYGQYSTSKFLLENGSTINSTNGIAIRGGTMTLVMNSALPANQQTATLNGKMELSNGASKSTLQFSAPITIGTTLTYGTFTVNGDVNWLSGTYSPGVDYTTPGLANQWIVNGTMTSANVDIISPVAQQAGNPPAMKQWLILTATQTAGNLPVMAAGSPLTVGSAAAGTKTVWKLSS